MDEFEQVVREKMQNRMDLAAVVTEIENDTFVPVISDMDLEAEMQRTEFHWSSDEFKSPEGIARREHLKKLYGAMKPERNAYVAIFLPEIWKSFENGRDKLLPSDNPGIKMNPDPLGRISDTTCELFNRKTQEWMERMEQLVGNEKELRDPEPRHKVKMYKRYDKLIEFGRKKGILSPQTNSADFIISGIITATGTSFAVAKLLFVEHAKEEPLEKASYMKSLGQTLRTVPVQFAMLDQAIVLPILETIQDPKTGFDMKYFTITHQGGSVSVKIDWEKVSKIINKYEDEGTPALEVDVKHATTACPAFIAKSDHNLNVLRDHLLWIYHVIDEHFDEIAEPYKRKQRLS